MREDLGHLDLFMHQSCYPGAGTIRDYFMCLTTSPPWCQWCQKCQVWNIGIMTSSTIIEFSGEKQNISVVDPSLLDGVDQLEALKKGTKVRENVHIHRDFVLGVHVYR